MNDFFSGLFESNFMPHGHCYQWQPEIVWLHAISDSVIAASYFAIPFLLIYFIKQRGDIAFKWVFGMFGAFILACGLTHVLEIWSIWNGTYRLTGLMKALTALISASTAVLLIPLVPKAIALPSPIQLEDANKALRSEMARRQEAEEAMRMLNAELEKRVAERTAEMSAANERLRYEVDERRAAEARAARLAAVVEASEDAVTRQTVDGIITDWNPGAERLYGYRAAEAIGQHIRLVIPERFHNHIGDLAGQIDSGERIRSIEVKRQTKDGDELTVSLSAVPIFDSEGRVDAVATIERDVTERYQAEHALREAEEMRRLALDAAKLGAWELDPSGERIVLDARCAQLYGFPPDQGAASYQEAGLRFHPQDAERVNDATVQALDPRGDGVFKEDYRVVWPDGSVHWIAGRGRAYFPAELDAPPSPETFEQTRFIGTMRDITDEHAARVEVDRAARLLRLSYDAIIVWHLDTDEGITFWNAGAEVLYGYRADEVAGRVTHDLLQSRHAVSWDEIKETLETRGVWEGQVRHITRSGEEVVVSSRHQLLEDEDGRVVIEINRDVTERDRAERLIEASLERYETLVEATAGIVWSTPPSGEFVHPQTSWEAFTGQQYPQHRGWGWLDAIHPEDRARTAAVWSDAIEQKHLYQVEHRLRRSDGVYRDMLVRAVPRISDNMVTEWVGLHTDVTHLKEAEAALEETKNAAEAANRAKSRFLASMSHELRTPLNAVIGYSELLQEEASDFGYESLLPELEKIRSAGKQLLSLVNDVLDLSKIEAGRVELSLKTVEIGPIVEGVVTVAAPLAQRNGNLLEAVIAPSIGTAHTDETKLRQVLFNLIGNAAKFTEKGRVDIEVELVPGDLTVDPDATDTETATDEPSDIEETLVFRVRDTGIGMTPDQMKGLFTSFYRTEEDSANFEGTGLGLAITQRLTRLMGGRVAVESERGVGTTFTVYLPRVIASDAAESANAAARRRSGIDSGDANGSMVQALATGSGTAPEPVVLEPAFERDSTKPLVLVIDDDPNARDLLRTYLQREGFDVAVAASGVQGLRLAHELHPTAITTDLAMPHLDGWDVLSALKSDPTLADIPVIVVTIEDDDRRVFALGAAEYLTKPVDRERLVQVTRRLIRTPENARVLIVEDNDATREIVQRTLANNGFVTSEASNGQEALLSLLEHHPDVILLDLMMPKMDGFELVDELRKHETWRTIPVVVMTAKDITPEERRRLQGFVETILTKGSYSRAELLREVCERVAVAAREAANDDTQAS